MPTVPQYSNLQATPTTESGATFTSPSGPSGASIGAEQMQGLGNAVSRAGDATARIALSMQEQTNQTQVNDAVNKARMAAQTLAYDPTTGYLNLKGEAALRRPNGDDLTTEYGGKLEEQMSSIGATLGNDVQRQQFFRNARDLSAQFHGQVQSHFLSEYRSHDLSVQKGTIDLASNDAKLNWNNPDLIAPSLNAAKAAVVNMGHNQGWSASQTDAALLTTTSKVHSEVVMSALEAGNTNYAAGYLAARRKEMSADDILKVQGHVDKFVDQGVAVSAVKAASAKAIPQIMPSGFDRLMNITVGSESGGQQFGKDGKPLTSKAGAIGIAQVMPGTAPEAAKLAGLEFDDARYRNDADYNRALGAAYLQKQLQTYGDPAKAWAAYNAGPGRLDKALKEADADMKRGAFRGGTPPDDYWLGKMPAETQAYVKKNLAALNDGAGGQGQRPTELDFVNSALQSLPAGASPQAQKLTRDQAAQQFVLIDKARKDAEDQAVANAMRVVQQVGGRFSDLPPAVRASIPPDKVDNVMNFAQRVFKGDDVTNPAVYQTLSNPTVLKGLSEDAFFWMRAELSQADFQHFAKERQSILQPKPGQQPGDADTAAIRNSVDENLRVLKIDPTPKDDGGNDAARVGAIRKYVNDEVLRAQALSGKKFNDVEVRQKVGELFAQQGTISGWFGNDAAPRLTMKAGDIPSDVAKKMKADFAKMGIDAPTDSQLIGAYWTLQARFTKPARP